MELSVALKEGILALVGLLRDRGVRASWARPETTHLTLKFLGDVEETSLQSVIEAVGVAAACVRGFTMTPCSLGAFPSPRKPRVLWLGVEPVDELYELQEAIESELAHLGFERERRRFHPHITLGRIRDPGGRDLRAELDALHAPRETVEVRNVVVMKSTLTAGGAVHEELASVPLAAGSESPAPG